MQITYLGIDAGRSGVKIAYFDKQGEIQRKQIPKFMDYIDWKSDQAVQKALEKWMQHFHLTIDAGAVVIGATGAAEFERLISQEPLIVELLGDITVAALSCGVELEGMLMIAGTGAALVVFKGNQKTIISAYGPIVGDPWGGLALGRLAVRHLLDQWAFGGEISPYEKSLAEALHISNRLEYVDWLQNSQNHYRELGQLGKITLNFAETGHAAAERIASEMIRAIVSVIHRTAQQFQLTAPLIGFQGSMIEESGWLRDRIRDQLVDTGIQPTFRLPQEPLDVTALHQAKSLGL